MTRAEDIKIRNVRRVLECLGNGEVWNKAALVDATELSSGAVTGILQELQDTGEVLFAGTAPSTGGRCPKEYQLNPDFRHVVQVVVTVTDKGYQVLCRTCDLCGRALNERTLDTPTCATEELVRIVVNMAQRDGLVGVCCVAIPGVSMGGRVVDSDVEALVGTNLVRELEEGCRAAGRRVRAVVENDVNAAAIGLWEECPADSLAMVYQPVRYYVGVGMVIGGRLYNGACHAAGELAYLPFTTKAQQEEALERDPEDLLAKQVATLCCVMNPQVVGICSRRIARPGDARLLRYVPREFWPQIVVVEELESKIEQGLAAIARDILRKTRGELQ